MTQTFTTTGVLMLLESGDGFVLIDDVLDPNIGFAWYTLFQNDYMPVDIQIQPEVGAAIITLQLKSNQGGQSNATN